MSVLHRLMHMYRMALIRVAHLQSDGNTTNTEHMCIDSYVSTQLSLCHSISLRHFSHLNSRLSMKSTQINFHPPTLHQLYMPIILYCLSMTEE